METRYKLGRPRSFVAGCSEEHIRGVIGFAIVIEGLISKFGYVTEYQFVVAMMAYAPLNENARSWAKGYLKHCIRHEWLEEVQ